MRLLSHRTASHPGRWCEEPSVAPRWGDHTANDGSTTTDYWLRTSSTPQLLGVALCSIGPEWRFCVAFCTFETRSLQASGPGRQGATTRDHHDCDPRPQGRRLSGRSGAGPRSLGKPLTETSTRDRTPTVAALSEGTERGSPVWSGATAYHSPLFLPRLQELLTLFTEFFASFHHCTCALSVPGRYTSLRWIHLALQTAVPSHSTRGSGRQHHGGSQRTASMGDSIPRLWPFPGLFLAP